MSSFMTLHITTWLHFIDIEAYGVVWALSNGDTWKIKESKRQQKSVLHREADNITEWMSPRYFPQDSCVNSVNGILATRLAARGFM